MIEIGGQQVPVVDGDGHIYEPGNLWTSRMDEKRWGDWIPVRELVDEWYELVHVGGELRGGGKEFIDQLCARFNITPEQYWHMLEGLRLPGASDPTARIADMERDGLDVAVIYPSQAMFYGPVDPIPALHDPEFVLACIQAYNDWLADYCRAYPDRLFGVAPVPLQFPGLAIAEAQRAVGELGHKAVFLRPAAYLDEKPFSHAEYDPFWTALQELGVPIAFHPGVHTDVPGACRKFGLVREDKNLIVANMDVDPVHGGSGLGQAIGNAVDTMVTMGRLLMGGVCERFPDLKFIFLESGGGWVATQLERMDEQVEAFPLERAWLSLKPSEYFARQCWVSFDPGEWNLAASAQFIGTDRILWASDYPHPEYRNDVVTELMKSVSPLPAEDQRKIVCDNAIAAYRLPVHAPA